MELGQEETDDEVAAREDEEAVKFASIPLEAWWVIVKNNIRGEVLDVCEQGKDTLSDYIAGIMEKNKDRRELKWKIERSGEEWPKQ
ncbi:MAG: hypothetical protein Q7J31_19200 [Syntrophales bacterium]|nr:hypothetical protein [Syntrophales bacterium]